MVYLVVFEVPKAEFKEEDSFQENLRGREFGCQVNNREQHSRRGDYWASLQRCGKADLFEGIAGFDLAGSRSSKRNRLGNKQGQRRMLYPRLRVFFDLGFHLVVNDETQKDLRQKHVKIRFAIEREANVFAIIVLFYYFSSYSSFLPSF